jgi:hypothetical protein
MVSHDSGNRDILYQYTATGNPSGSEFEVIYYAIGIVVFVVWWMLDQ